MNKLLVSGLLVLILSCATTHKPPGPGFLRSPDPIDRKIGSATLEDYILAMPAYQLHEGDRAGFEATVRNARTLPRNQGRPADQLYVPGDGGTGPHEFSLDRASRTLTIRSIGIGDDTPPSTSRYQRIPGGWLMRE